jgi:hypothetical protein
MEALFRKVERVNPLRGVGYREGKGPKSAQPYQNPSKPLEIGTISVIGACEIGSTFFEKRNFSFIGG